MAGDWIKIEHALPDKPEVIKMADILGIDPDAVVGKLIRFWIWLDVQSIDGNALTVTKTFLDRYTFQQGFADALIQVDWLRVRSGSLEVPQFDRHNGQTAKSRSMTNRRVAKSRKCNADTVTDVTTTSLQKPLPEKRREEKRIIPDGIIDSDPSKKLSRQQRTARELQAAQQVELGMLASPELKNAWREWQEFRTSLFLEPLTGESISPWTEIAAKRAANDLERMAQKYGDAETVSQVQLAIANRWKAVYAPKDTHGTAPQPQPQPKPYKSHPPLDENGKASWE